MITNDLKASHQCTAACNKANRILGMINRTIVYKSKEVLLKLYKSLVRPHVEYCTPVWSPCYQKDKILIEKVQHRFTRMIPGFSKLPYSERLKRLGLWSLEERRNRADLIEVFKIVKGLSGVPLESMFDLSTNKHHRFTRMIPGFSKLPYSERLIRLGLWSLEERRNRADLIEVFKTVGSST